MKGTIFEKGKKISNKLHRHAAWFRVKKYWLFMPRKEYYKNLFFNIWGLVSCALTVFAGIWAFFDKVLPFAFEKGKELFENN